MISRKANLFIVGHPKCATTSMYHQLNAHSDIFFPSFKEPKVFCTDFHEESDDFHGENVYAPIRTMRQYAKLYEFADQPVLGDATPLYLYSPKAPENIKKYNKDAKIIINLREPVSFLSSLHSEFVYTLNEDEFNFEKALKLETYRKHGKQLPVHVRVPRYLFYSDWIQYKQQLKRYFDLFPSENIQVNIFEEIKENNQTIIENILTFLGLNLNDYKFPQHVDKNPSHVLRYKRLRKFFQTPIIYSTIRNTIPEKYYGFFNEINRKVFKKDHERKPLSNNLIIKLKQQYFPAVKETNDFLIKQGFAKIDLLTLWGYKDFLN